MKQRGEKTAKNGIKFGKIVPNLSFFTNDTIIYLENPTNQQTTGTNNWMWQNHGIKDEYAKINWFLYIVNKQLEIKF